MNQRSALGRLARFALLGTAATLGLAALGRALGPRHRPRQLTGDLTPNVATPEIVSDVARPGPGSHDVEIEDVVISLPSGGRVNARLRWPVTTEDRLPAVVFMHGAGTHAYDASFEEQAQGFASAGFVTLVPDRGSSYYSGVERDYEAMARDYLFSWSYLVDHPRIDSDRVGIYAESEGAWVAPIAAAVEPGVAFLVLASAPIVPGRHQFSLAADTYLRQTNVPLDVFDLIPRYLGGRLPWRMTYVDFDVRRHLERIKAPVLMVYGTGDAAMPIIQAPLQARADLLRGGNREWMLRYFDRANHGLKIGPRLAPGFTDAVTTWMRDPIAARRRSPQIAGARPDQRFLAREPERPHRLFDGWMKVAWPVAAWGLISVGVAIDAWQRHRGQSVPPGPYRLSAAAQLMTMAGFGQYVRQIANLALQYRTNDAMARGGWCGLEALAGVSTGIFVYSVDAAIRSSRLSGWRTPPLGYRLIQFGGLLAQVNAAYWGLYSFWRV